MSLEQHLWHKIVENMKFYKYSSLLYIPNLTQKLAKYINTKTCFNSKPMYVLSVLAFRPNVVKISVIRTTFVAPKDLVNQ